MVSYKHSEQFVRALLTDAERRLGSKFIFDLIERHRYLLEKAENLNLITCN